MSVHRGWVSQHALEFSPRGVGIPACLAGQSWGYPQHAFQVPGGSGPGGVWSQGGSGPRESPIFWGVLQLLRGLQFFRGVLQFWGGRLRGAVKEDPPIFLGGIFFLISAFFGDTPPLPGPDTGIQSMFGRYASYWNAFLFTIMFKAVTALQHYNSGTKQMPDRN